LKRWAQNLGLSKAVTLLDATLKEEEKTDVDLTRLADADANAKAKRAA
jgi:ferritin-like metal-binding protein YciE